MQNLLRICLCLCLTQVLDAQNFNNGFSFYLPEFDSSSQTFLPSFPAYTITAAHRVKVQGEQFVANGKPIRFWGVNITAAAAFPPKDKAAGIAARMRKMGINLVRFHHLENNWSGLDGCIFNYVNGTRSLQAATLDRLDFFIAQLKKNGIYVNMNLNVSREFQPKDGVPGADSIPDFAKGVTLFDGYLQLLQKEYAEQLLGHNNPYTGLPLAEDPVLAMVEMNNENTLYGYWKDGLLRPFAQGGGLMWRHNSLLDALWREYLAKKYSTPNGGQAALAAAWNKGASPSGTSQFLTNPGFETGIANAPWSIELHETAQATFEATTKEARTGKYSGRLSVSNVTGTSWHIQMKQSGFSLKKDSAYVVRFWVKSDKSATLSVSMMRDNAPYNWYGGTQVAVGTDWREVVFSFTANEDNNGFGRLSISPEQNTGNFWFDDFSLSPPSLSGLLPGEELVKGNIKRILWAERQQYTNGRMTDMADFYIEVQKSHFDDLKAQLQQNVGVLAPITGTNALVGPADVAHQEDLDYIDDHSYWDHPWFPGQAWDPSNWLISNQPMLKSDRFNAITAAFSGLNLTNKPFTVSEYNHPAPNRWKVEMPVAMAAYGAFHGMDGVMFYEYNGDFTWEPDVQESFFSINRDNSVMALFPSCAWAYRQGMIAADPDPLKVEYARKDLGAQTKVDSDGRWGRYTPYDKALLLTHSVRTNSCRSTNSSNFNDLPQASAGPFISTTGETTLDVQKGILTTETPGFCSVTGFLQDAPNTKAGDLTMVKSTDYGAVTWVSTVGTPLQTAKRSLLTISSKQQNTGMIWNGTQTVGNNWGSAPTLQNPLELTLQLNIKASSIKLYPLNNTGKEGVAQTILPNANGIFELNIKQAESKTLWYGIEASGPSITGTSDVFADLNVQLSPNPAYDQIRVSWGGSMPSDTRIALMDMHGKMISSMIVPEGTEFVDFQTHGLTSGTYTILLEHYMGKKLIPVQVLK